MCVSAAAALTALSIGQGVASYVGQKQQADANSDMALANQQLQIRSLNNQAREDTRRRTEELEENSVEAARRTATARVAAGEAGVAGLSVEELLGDIRRQEAENSRRIEANFEAGVDQRALQNEGVALSTQSQINQVPEPSFIGTAFEVGANAFNTYQTTSRRQAEIDRLEERGNGEATDTNLFNF